MFYKALYSTQLSDLLAWLGVKPICMFADLVQWRDFWGFFSSQKQRATYALTNELLYCKYLPFSFVRKQKYSRNDEILIAEEFLISLKTIFLFFPGRVDQYQLYPEFVLFANCLKKWWLDMEWPINKVSLLFMWKKGK